jgi:hypothetical protein
LVLELVEFVLIYLVLMKRRRFAHINMCPI